MKQRERNQDGHLWEENGKWWLRYTEYFEDGSTRRPVKCVGTKEQYPTKTKARAAADEIMAEVNNAVAVTRWEHLCDHYQKNGMDHVRGKTQYRSLIKRLRDAFCGQRVDHLLELRGRLLIKNWLHAQKVTAGYRRQFRMMLDLIFNHGLEYDLCNENPMEKISVHNTPTNTKPRRRRDVLRPEQFMALMNHPTLPDFAKVIVAVMEITGLRSCEALGLSWEHGQPGDAGYRPSDIDLFSAPPRLWVRRSTSTESNDDWLIYGPKTEDSKRTAALPPALVQMLIRFRAKFPVINDWVFGSRQTGIPWTRKHIHLLIKEAARDLGFDYFGFGLHNHRHTFRRNLKVSGAGLEDQARALGHSVKNIEQTTEYGLDGVDFAEDLAPYAAKVVELLEANGRLDAICQSPASDLYQMLPNQGDGGRVIIRCTSLHTDNQQLTKQVHTKKRA